MSNAFMLNRLLALTCLCYTLLVCLGCAPETQAKSSDPADIEKQRQVHIERMQQEFAPPQK
jgi:hypothetical protein